MPPVFDHEKCSHCGKCENLCMADAIRLTEDGTPFVKYPKECWHCGACRMDCPNEAILIQFSPWMLTI